VHDVLVVGGGTAGCVLAARLSEDPTRRVCLLEAGPDYGPLDAGRWPADILDPGALAESHDWGPAGEDRRSLGARILGGSSAVNACMVVRGTPADYDEWGPDWAYERFAAFLDRAAEALGTARANTATPTPFHLAFIEAAQAAGLSDAAPYPANVVNGRRWNAALAYLEPARDRSNLEIVDDTVVDQVAFEKARATGVLCGDGRRYDADTVILAAGAYFSPAILIRSGIGPEAQLRALDIPVVEPLPVGERLLDHHGTSTAWEPTERLHAETAAHVRNAHLFEAHAVVKAASTSCPPDAWDIHILPFVYPADTPGRYQVSTPLFHMKPLSTGRLSLRSRDPSEAPLVERGFLSREEDLSTLIEAIEMARAIAVEAPLAPLLGAELRPGGLEPADFARATMRNYFHPAGTCPIGEVVDVECRLYGTEGLFVADASVMPTIPRANTNLTTAAIAERIAASFG
jgi:choline dehydrogenase-like flavoprotein